MLRQCRICPNKLNRNQTKVCSVECRNELCRREFRGKGKREYIQIRVNGKRKYFHRHVWEEHNGRKLAQGEIVHHINENKRDNRPENLEVLSGRAAHLHVHNYNRKQKQSKSSDFSEMPF